VGSPEGGQRGRHGSPEGGGGTEQEEPFCLDYRRRLLGSMEPLWC